MKFSAFAHILAFTVSFVSAVTAVAEPPAVVVSRFDEALDQQAEKVSKLARDPRSANCEARYARIWAEGRLRVDWFYGYLQSEKADIVSDRLVRYTTVHSLMKPCLPGVTACGFMKAADLTDQNGPIVLEKKLDDGRMVELRMWNSAREDWNSKNTVGLGHFFVADKEQKKKTRTVWTAFLESFREAPVVIYDGHSEFGKGPGFGPMSWPDYAIGYLAAPSMKRVVKSLRKPGPDPEVFMLAACESKKYYLDKYRKLLPQTAIVATDKAQEFAVGEQTVFGFLDSILAGRCEAGIEQALVPSTGTDAGAHIYGFEMDGL